MKLFKRQHLLNPTTIQRLLYHVLFWLLLFLLRLYLTLITFNVYSGFPITYLLLLNLLSTLLIAATYYVINCLVWPHIRNKRFLKAMLFLVATLLAYTSLDAITEQIILNICTDCLSVLRVNQLAYFNLIQSGFINIFFKRLLSLGTPFLLLLTLSIPICIKLALHTWRAQIRALELAKNNVELEFNFLKSQINPHFLFNTLNNIYGLILKQDTARSAELVARLSALLRYMLYETDEHLMPLEEEIRLLKDYIALEKIRLNETQLATDIYIDTSGYFIPPLLLIPLIENAFKFCSDKPEAYIQLFLDVMQGRLLFTLENTVDPNRIPAMNNGIGLVNFRKRLDLYYADRYWYEASLNKDIYCVTLSIDLV